MDTASAASELLASLLSSLAKKRMEQRSWSDAEQDAGGTQVFKLGEALRPFYLVLAERPGQYDDHLLGKRVLVADTQRFFKAVQKQQFFPSPYSAVESDDQYTDFAAFTLELGDLVLRAHKQNYRIPATLLALVEETIRLAIAFLTDPKHYRGDDDGVRWAGTSTHSLTVKRRATQSFTDVYFTSTVMLGLKRIAELPADLANKVAKDRAAALISRAGKWIAGRANASKLLAGDEDRSNLRLLYTTWGLRALAETYSLQELATQNATKSIAVAYLGALAKELSAKGIAITQDYLDICSTEFETKFQYEERSSWAGVLLSLLSLSRVQEFEALLDETDFPKLLDTVYQGLLSLRDPATDLWYNEYFIISIHAFIAEALLRMSAAQPSIGYSFPITSSMVGRAVKAALEDSRLSKLLHLLVYENLQRVSVAKAPRPAKD